MCKTKLESQKKDRYAASRQKKSNQKWICFTALVLVFKKREEHPQAKKKFERWKKASDGKWDEEQKTKNRCSPWGVKSVEKLNFNGDDQKLKQKFFGIDSYFPCSVVYYLSIVTHISSFTTPAFTDHYALLTVVCVASFIKTYDKMNLLLIRYLKVICWKVIRFWTLNCTPSVQIDLFISSSVVLPVF